MSRSFVPITPHSYHHAGDMHAHDHIESRARLLTLRCIVLLAPVAGAPMFEGHSTVIIIVAALAFCLYLPGSVLIHMCTVAPSFCSPGYLLPWHFSRHCTLPEHDPQSFGLFAFCCLPFTFNFVSLPLSLQRPFSSVFGICKLLISSCARLCAHTCGSFAAPHTPHRASFSFRANKSNTTDAIGAPSRQGGPQLS